MNLEERIAEAVRTHADSVTPPPTNVARLLRRARHQRRTRAAAVICSAVAFGGVAVSIQGDDTRPDPPAVDRPQSAPTQVITRSGETVVVPNSRDDQVVVTPDIDPSDLETEELAGSASTTEDKYAGATDLSVQVPVFTDDFRWEVYCAGAPDLHYIFTIGPNASYFETGRCDGTASTAFPPAPRDEALGMQYSSNRRAHPETLQARIFVTDRSPREYKQCYEYSPPNGCDDVEPPQASRAELSFGVAMYESAPPVLVRMFGFDISGLTTFQGTDYMLDRAVAAPTGSALTYELAASSKQRLVQTVPGTDAGELELRVDGQRVDVGALLPGRGPGVVLEPGGAHEITVAPSADVSEDLNLGLVVFEATG